MSEPKAIVPHEWSSLNTISDFDVGLSSSGRDIISVSKDVSEVVIKSLLIESLIDQLCKFLEKDPVKRQNLYKGICSKLYEMQLIENTYNVEEFASLRGHYQQALLDVMVDTDRRICSTPCLKLGSSRYANEYEEICFLAAGGFGKVFKAKNRLDQVIYAVKKIALKYQNITTFGRKLNEVKTLAKLNHPNIVNYKSAWLEPLFNVTPTTISSDVTNLSSNDSDIIVFKNNKSSSDSETSNLIHEERESNKNMTLCKYREFQKPVSQISALLYVSMQLCDGTLCDWLHQRNLFNEPVNMTFVLYLMTEIATGVQYIHSCNVVHHDIKPRNIFLSSDLRSVQMGDFGLSCCLQGHDHSYCALEGGQFGTPLYAAPEQLKGRCDFKSDMFSLGLVFIELLTVFSTEMERVKVLTKARSGHLPDSIPLSLEPIIKNLISHKPKKRPTASQLIHQLQDLKDEFYDRVVQTVEMTENQNNIPSKTLKTYVRDLDTSICKSQLIIDKDKEISELREMLAQREIEIARLKTLINENS